ncbi:unnamed protein product [Hydatigera taeniaeformis]|uniref:THAP4-like heme-binding domain-containing protein n=1 Tax=Hydatigena taeniaeformis TaxID=6205 RepID=A0A3P7HM14_HYDTA|nr:unnamed protein product [Hydatigera taeniaeformis]
MQPFAKLLGEWEGEGSMSLYTQTTYPCSENISIGHVGQPSFWYSDNTGHVHILKGPARNEHGRIHIVLETELTEGHPLPKKPKMLRVRREIALLDNDTLTQKVFMATEKKTDMTLHTNMIYKRLPKLPGSGDL